MDENKVAMNIELSRAVLQDIVDSYLVGDEHKVASMCIEDLYELASMYQGLCDE